MNGKALSMDDVIHELRNMKEQLRARYRVTRIGVFGSLARGEAGAESDVDIVVEMEPNLFLRAGLKAELTSRLGRPVDVIRYREGMNSHLKRRIDREVCYV
jgi:predicted nucleotidyltransferase